MHQISPEGIAFLKKKEGSEISIFVIVIIYHFFTVFRPIGLFAFSESFIQKRTSDFLKATLLIIKKKKWGNSGLTKFIFCQIQLEFSLYH